MLTILVNFYHYVTSSKPWRIFCTIFATLLFILLLYGYFEAAFADLVVRVELLRDLERMAEQQDIPELGDLSPVQQPPVAVVSDAGAGVPAPASVIVKPSVPSFWLLKFFDWLFGI